MNNTSRLARLSLLAGLALAAGQAYAGDDQGFYLGLTAGQSKLDINGSEIDAALVAAGAATSTTTVDDSDNAWKILAGYQVNKNFGVELFYTDLGSFNSNTTTTGPAGTVNGNVDTTAWGVDLVGRLPLGESFALFAKIGAYRWDADATVAAIVAGATASGTASDSGTDVKFGLGAQYDFTRNFGVRAEWERYSGSGSNGTGGSEDLDVFSVGVSFRF